MRDVVILGGGAAGIAAAWRLRDLDLLVLEAEDRLGGRLHSLASGDHWVNLGAHLFPGAGSQVHEVVSGLGLDVVEIPGIKTAIWWKGVVHRTRHVEAYPFKLELAPCDRVALARAGLRLVRSVRSWYVAGRPRSGEGELARRQRMGRYEADRTFSDLLGPLPPDVDLIFRAAGRRAAAELEDQSAAAGISLFGALWVGRNSQSQVNILGGSGRFGDAMQLRLGAALQLGATATAVSPVDGGVRVDYDAGGTKRSVTARFVVVATPAGVARRIITDVAADVSAALESVTYGPFVCMGVATTETGQTPWDDIYAMTTPGLSFDMLFNHANPLRTLRPRRPGGSLMCYAGGGQAAALLEVPDDDIEQRFRSDLLRVYPQLDAVIGETVVQKWPIGNFYRTPCTDTTVLVRPAAGAHSRVHLAGDYLAAHGGTIEAAVTSGFDAARAVRNDLGCLARKRG